MFVERILTPCYQSRLYFPMVNIFFFFPELFRHSLIKPESTSNLNVILVGERGSGKTSIINMIAGKVVAPTSEATGTRSCSVYPIPIGELVYNVYDTPGLDALELGSDPVTKLIKDMHGGVDLLVFCLRGRLTEDAVAIYKHFSWSLLVNVPVIAVITGLEHEDPMQSWWTKNNAAFMGYGMLFADCACVTTLRGKGSIFAIQYEESMDAVRAMIATRCLPKGQREVSFVCTFYS